jgi:hypothetical protein
LQVPHGYQFKSCKEILYWYKTYCSP